MADRARLTRRRERGGRGSLFLDVRLASFPPSRSLPSPFRLQSSERVSCCRPPRDCCCSSPFSLTGRRRKERSPPSPPLISPLSVGLRSTKKRKYSRKRRRGEVRTATYDRPQSGHCMYSFARGLARLLPTVSPLASPIYFSHSSLPPLSCLQGCSTFTLRVAKCFCKPFFAILLAAAAAAVF